MAVKDVGTGRNKRVKDLALAEKFVPSFWSAVDGRTSIAKQIKKRYSALKKDSGADSVAKDLLCQRAIYMAIRLETMEVESATSGEPCDLGIWTAMTNSLLGLLRAIGLEKELPQAPDLEKYVKERVSR